MAIALEPGYQYQVEFNLRTSCRSVVRDATVGVWWNGRLVRRQTLAGCGLHAVNATVAPDSIDPNCNILRLDSEPANADSAPASTNGAGTIGLTALAVVRIESPAGRN
jgi:hypothetical protein